MRKTALNGLVLALLAFSTPFGSGRVQAADGPAIVTTSPANRTVLQDGPTTFTVVVDGTAPFSYQWLKNGTPIGGATGAAHSIASVQPADEALYSVLVTNALGNAASSPAELLVDPGVLNSTSTNLFGFTKTWRYNQTDDLSAVNWFTNTYNDSAWSGPGGGLLYVEDATLAAPKTTALTIGRVTYYFRTEFVFSNTGNVSLSVNTYLDDGAVLYLNGVEWTRIGVDPGAVSYNTLANRTVTDAALEGPLDLPATNLRVGTNVLAVEVHQINATSSDIVWGMSLDAVSQSRAADTVAPAIYGASGSNTTLTVNFSERVEPATATNKLNYTINNGVTVSAAVFGVDSNTIVLTVATLTNGGNYILTVNNVRDRAVTPNTLAANSQVSFTVGSTPFGCGRGRPAAGRFRGQCRWRLQHHRRRLRHWRHGRRLHF